VLVVLTGLLLLPCADGMMVTAPGAMSAMAAGTCAHPAAMVGAAPVACAATDAPGSGDMGGVLAACLVLLIVVLATVVGARPSVLRIMARTGARIGAALRERAGARALSLAQLCLLRT
jgi:hypothetical protein